MRVIFTSIILLTLFGTAAPTHAALISEFSPNQPGADPTTQDFEISGIAGMDFTFFVLSINGSAGSMGLVETAFNFSGAFDSNGLFVVNVNDLVDPTHTVVLATNFTGSSVADGRAGATDIDPLDNGNLNLSTISGIQDAIGIARSPDDIGRGALYGTRLGGQDFAFFGTQTPFVFRDASVGAWYGINNPASGQIFDINGNDIAGTVVFNGDPFRDSFGAINPTAVAAVPEPSTVVALAGLTLWGVFRMRRRRRIAAKNE